MKDEASNIAFIDGQNLHLGTTVEGWKIDYRKFYIYLKETYQINVAYYFIGYHKYENVSLYERLEDVGFRILFKTHDHIQRTDKKGNVDVDIVFEIMKNLIENVYFNKIILVSGDGDYIKVVKYLIVKDKFEKILFPNKNYSSSLYKKLGNHYYDFLSKKDIKNKINYTPSTKNEQKKRVP